MKNALIFLAVTFCVLFAIGYTPSSYHKQAECAKVSQHEILLLGDAIISGEIPEKSIDKKTKEYQDKRNLALACSDLAAQWSVANLTFRAFMVGLIALGALIATLAYTRDAANAARQTLSIADETLSETIKANRRGQRAYIGIKTAVVESFGESQSIEVNIWIQNFGSSPACLIESVIGGGMFDIRSDNDDELEIPFEQVISVNSTRIVSSKIINSGADRMFIFGSDDRIDDQFAGFQFENNKYLIAAKFTYRDIFGFTYDFIFRGSVLPFHHEKGSSLNCIEETETKHAQT